MEIIDIVRELKKETTPRGRELVNELLDAILSDLEKVRTKLTEENNDKIN